jgi:Flp pilus assembly protein TadG
VTSFDRKQGSTKMKAVASNASARHQRGAVAIVVGLCMAVLIGFAGLALDGGRLYVNKTELQNAADACALAASYELTGTPIAGAAYTRAVNAGLKVTTENRVDFQGPSIRRQTRRWSSAPRSR